jgi:hypothetical protein
MTKAKLRKLWEEWWKHKSVRDDLPLNHVDRLAWDGICNAQLIRILELKDLAK